VVIEKFARKSTVYVTAMITLPFNNIMDKHYEMLERDGMAKQLSSLTSSTPK
jgi:hypothetical protein